MAGQFLSPDGDLESAFVSDPAIIDQFAKTGSLWAWGQNNNGQLGDGTATGRSTPVQTVAGGTNWSDVTGSGTAGMGIKTDGTLWAWGSQSSYGNLGDGTLTTRSSPVQVAGTTWKKLAVGLRDNTAAIKTDGTLWIWGINAYGTIGDNTTTSRSSPVQTVAGGNSWKDVGTGWWNASGLKTDGTLWVWGDNTYGQIGDNTTVSKSSPVQIAGTTWKQAALFGIYHSVGIKTDGTIWTWGDVGNGALGDNQNTTSRSSPVQIAGTTWKMVSSGFYHVAAIKTDGTLWVWGRGGNSQLGDGTLNNRSSPVQTAVTGTNWKMVSCGRYHTTAVKTDGTLWTWGRGRNGELGDGTTSDDRLTPAQIVGNNWKKVSAGGSHTFGIYFYDAGNLYP
jgi:alpha-tubulin suppressor-like RCC1 family protein